MTLHLYQPPTQEPEIIGEILKSCYLPLLRTLSNKSGFGITLNISGSLLLQLKKLGADEFFDLAKKLIYSEKIEIINSAMYHPLIPLIPNDVVIRQIQKNTQTLKELLGVETTNGFFPPELAIDTESLDLTNSNYIFVDESSVGVKDPIVKYGKRYLLVNNHEVCNLLRSYQKELDIKTVTELVRKSCDENGLIVTVNDAELFGHHYSERLDVLSELLDTKEIKFIKSSETIAKFGSQSPVVSKILPSTWQDCQKFDLWNKNDLQKRYLKLLKAVYGSILNSSDKKTLDSFDQGTSSCYLYWLSNWPWWHPRLVQNGAERLIECTKAPEAHRVYKDFLDQMWKYHKSGKVEAKYKKYDETALTEIHKKYV